MNSTNSSNSSNSKNSIKRLVVCGDGSGLRLDSYLAAKLNAGLSRARIQRLIRGGSVLLNGQKASAHHKVRPQDKISLVIPAAGNDDGAPQPEDIPLDVVYEDEDLLVINKPRGLVVHPGAGNRCGTLVNALLFHCPRLSDIDPRRPGIVHRLDKDTAGLLVVAKNNPAHLCLARQFAKHSVRRVYVALVCGCPKERQGIVDLPIGRHPVNRVKMAVSFCAASRSARTAYRVLKSYEGISLAELYPRTGRTHQLRVHMAALGHPIWGDPVYGRGRGRRRSTLALYARYLGFIHPVSKQLMEFEHPLPEDMLPAV